MKYALIKEHCDTYSVTMMCRSCDVSTSGYYTWLARKPGPRAERTAAIRESVAEVYRKSNGVYGSRKIAKHIQQDETQSNICRKTVAKAMMDLGLKSCVSKRFKTTTTITDPTKKAAPNILNQEFTASRPDEKWVTDITFLPTATGWVYLAVVLDLFSRKVVGWTISNSLATPLVSQALKNSIQSRKPDTNNLLHHSDRGCQYTSTSFQKTLATLGITCSMSRTGCCYDNAVIERFFWSLKKEWTNHQVFKSIEDARTSVFKYIETFYNANRIHQTLHYKTPDQFEEQYHAILAA